MLNAKIVSFGSYLPPKVVTNKDLEKMINGDIERKFNHKPDYIKVTSTDNFIDDGRHKGCWIGTMTVFLSINNEEYILSRDWGEEHNHDKKHPNYNDDYFYDSDDCFSWKKGQELCGELKINLD